jgi:hypothetical protein
MVRTIQYLRSKMSTAWSVTSPCTNKGMPISDIVCNTDDIFPISVTPISLLVVAPAGYNLQAKTRPDSNDLIISSGLLELWNQVRFPVRYTLAAKTGHIPSEKARQTDR